MQKYNHEEYKMSTHETAEDMVLVGHGMKGIEYMKYSKTHWHERSMM